MVEGSLPVQLGPHLEQLRHVLREGSQASVNGILEGGEGAASGARDLAGPASGELSSLFLRARVEVEQVVLDVLDVFVAVDDLNEGVQLVPVLLDEAAVVLDDGLHRRIPFHLLADLQGRLAGAEVVDPLDVGADVLALFFGERLLPLLGDLGRLVLAVPHVASEGLD